MVHSRFHSLCLVINKYEVAFMGLPNLIEGILSFNFFLATIENSLGGISGHPLILLIFS